MKYLDKTHPVALLVMRVVLGVIMIAHGYGKVFGGIPKHVGFVRSLGMPGWTAYLSAGAEFVGGILVIAGLLTRPAAFAILMDMAVAIAKVHWKNGLKGPTGYEFPLSLAALAFALMLFGAGPVSLDWLFGGHKRGSE